ncbi:protein O-glucosyltransferase 1-like isoform X1 [Patiria miniata]|nr:protein O-glucosyltransferase 1-like isoform X1 [Patiria miniata]
MAMDAYSYSPRACYTVLIILTLVYRQKIVLAEEWECHMEEGNCDSKDSFEDGKTKYHLNRPTNPDPEAKWQPYLDAISSAVMQYKDCEQDSCTCHDSVIEKDLSVWREKGGITQEQFKKALGRGIGNHYQIINHKLYRSKRCMFAARCSGVEHFILKIIKKLPDMEFILNERDWPQSPKFADPLPVLSFSKVYSQHWDIMYPAWTFWEGGPAVWPLFPTGLGRWDLFRESLDKEAKKLTWDKKETKAFFRGSRTSAERDPLILLSRDDRDLVDAQYTKNQAWKSDADTLYMPPATEVSLEEHCRFK